MTKGNIAKEGTKENENVVGMQTENDDVAL